MSSLVRLAWELYLIFAVALAAGKAYNFFAPDTPQHLYWRILYAFDPIFWIPYTLTLLQILLNAVHCLPLALYIYRRRLGPPVFWKIMFAARVLSEITGHAYEANIIRALLRSDPLLAVLTMALMAVPYAPSYWACWRYAFGREKLSARSSIRA